jgi:hypothetical protein
MDTNAAILLAMLVAIGVGATCWHFGRRSLLRELRGLESQIRELEKKLHEQERLFLEERNRTEDQHRREVHEIRVEHEKDVRQARERAFAEGREQGNAENTAKHIEELSTLRNDLGRKFEQDREQAVSDSREKVRAEYELQTKLFSVKVAPYVCITEAGSLFSRSFETQTGYQYQLLVNGIPAFTPHVVIEQREQRKEINEAVVDKLIGAAKELAEQAIHVYLGGSSQFAKLASPILRKLPVA